MGLDALLSHSQGKIMAASHPKHINNPVWKNPKHISNPVSKIEGLFISGHTLSNALDGHTLALRMNEDCF